MLEAERETLEGPLQQTASKHIGRCRTASGLIQSGINLLATDRTVWDAFQFANWAMWEQFARNRWLRSGRPDSGPKLDPEATWYPFQLAFILLCLDGIAEPKHDDREYVDLLWFPTGGGKTEAYLGLIAFTVFLCRFRNGAKGGGVTAIMRYTLRLLTLQQFQRAAVLITTCEDIRRRTPALGGEPISLAMWVGQAATPNNLDEARESLEKIKLNGEHSVEEKNPIQLKNCPWCGNPLDYRNYWIAADNRRLVISCNNIKCEFGRGLPIYVVDEDIYNFHPTLIISTVDKFASLPWRDNLSALFNLREDGSHEQLPPELIIQDELHLISGPLGTLTGLYETAIDLLCSHEGRPPKVIASTATIRRAADQSLGLFGREVRQFPPPGLDARNSYFAVEAPREEKGTRLYLGLMAPATSHTTLLVRAYARLLQSISEIEAAKNVKDPYWTLLGYFNSLRVLGGARLQVDDDIVDRITLLSSLDGTEERPVETVIELTSRERSGNISERLKQIEVEYPDPEALDVVLATNMISVGVDIDRLGIMLVMGQPQSTSEYIQATSRVGRKYPGLVGVLFNGAKSRDRSHYESFTAFHSAIYRQVEASSVTPFSARARDRGLHAVLIALVRLLFPEFRPNRGASAVLSSREVLESMADVIVERVKVVSPEEAEATARQLDEIIEQWHSRAKELDGKLVYNNPYAPETTLLIPAGVDDLEGENKFETLWSLRDVDKESNLYLAYLGKDN